jgi:hypothetical protein
MQTQQEPYGRSFDLSPVLHRVPEFRRFNLKKGQSEVLTHSIVARGGRGGLATSSEDSGPTYTRSDFSDFSDFWSFFVTGHKKV